MAYNPYYPYYGQQSQQMQSNGLVSVRSIDEALRYPVAPGNSVTFKDETAPYIYTKTMGFSQLDRPIFERFRLIKEDNQEEPAVKTHEPQAQAQKVDIDIRKEIDDLKKRMEAVENELTKPIPADESKSNAASAAEV